MEAGVAELVRDRGGVKMLRPSLSVPRRFADGDAGLDWVGTLLGWLWFWGCEDAVGGILLALTRALEAV